MLRLMTFMPVALMGLIIRARIGTTTRALTDKPFPVRPRAKAEVTAARITGRAMDPKPAAVAVIIARAMAADIRATTTDMMTHPPPPPPPGYYRRGYGGGYGRAPRPGDYGPQTNRAQDCYNVYGNRICCPKGWTVQNGQCQPYRGR